MLNTKKVFIILKLFLVLFQLCKSSEGVKYTNLEMLYEDPLYYESWTFTRELYKNSSFIDNDKEICYFLSSNWKYENHNVFIEYIFATKNYKNLKINLYKIIINHDETVAKSYYHDVENAWKVIVFEKMIPQGKLYMNDERLVQLNKMVDKWITKGQKYKLLKVDNVSFFEKVNQVQESNVYICSATLAEKDENGNETGKYINEEFLFEEEISTGNINMRYVIYRNPNK